MFLVFPFTGLLLFALVAVATHIVLHRVSIRTLVSLSEARCRLGFSRRIDAAIYRPAWKAKTRSPSSSEHGVVATRKHKHSSGSFWVERDVGLLRGPDAMEQNSQLARHGNHRPCSWPVCHLGRPDADPTPEVPSPSHVDEEYGSHTRSADFGDRRYQLL